MISNSYKLARIIGLVSLFVCLIFFVWFFVFYEAPVDYNTEVKPILNKKCITCHGGVKKSAEFSLLFQNEALAPTKSGHPAIIPGDARHSEFIKRITHLDPEERMPPESPPLSAEEIDVLTRWIDQGANWGEHWAYKTITEVPVPQPASFFAGFSKFDVGNWVRNDIDRFVLSKLQEEKLQPSKQANPAVLARRVSLDLIGLPPPKHLYNVYMQNPNDEAYELLVDSLLAQPIFGERWASMWLDLARYADSKGYEKDSERTIWKYRDWVIKAFNEDKPFDQFTIEQLAGDLLPNPTDDQLLATGFHRNTMNNDEGGTDDEEFRVAAVLDRVNTTMDTWMGTTFACVQCHSHPYDPFKQEEYYQFYAFFNNSQDEDVPGEYPNIRFYEKAEDQAKIDSLKNWVLAHTQSEEKVKELDYFLKTIEPKVQPHAFDTIVKGALIDNKYLGVEAGGFARLSSFHLQNYNKLLLRYGAQNAGGTVEIHLDNLDGELITTIPVKSNGTLWGFKADLVDLKAIEGVHDLYFVFDGKPGYVWSMEWMLFMKSLPGEEDTEFTKHEKLITELTDAEVKRSPIMLDHPSDFKRKTHVFERGNWTAHGEEVKAGTPDFLHPLAIRNGQSEADRLDLANWIMSPENPLTARVMVNRFWEQLFGKGILETTEDFGTQGEKPSHPELLEWLAWNFMHDYKWSMKMLLKEMVLSSTYRQDSKVNNELLAKDPANRLLARGPRFRLSGEQVRDQALAVSGLLSDKMYGKGVMPPQPEGVWQVIYSGLKWKTSEGEDRYRRAVYTFWRRTSPYPSMISFDAPSREFCVPRRIRTNTPLQSLVTLNDPVYIETAIALAQKMLKDSDINAAIEKGYQEAMLKEISTEKKVALQDLWQEAYAFYQENDSAVVNLLNFPKAYDEPVNEKQPSNKGMEGKVNLETADIEKSELPDKCEGDCEKLAAMTVVANAILNMDEFLTKE
ncbi:MAG: hypothetical protein CMO01_26635 [Thalassobius sp.]|nr:hypothetical protein [Thalassovita sp.]